MQKVHFFKKLSSIVGAVAGLISIILGFVVSFMSIGSYEGNEMYGGDAYTGIQNAAAQTANNVQYLADIVKTSTSFILIILGLAMICYFALKYMSLTEKSNNFPVEEQNTAEQPTL